MDACLSLTFGFWLLAIAFGLSTFYWARLVRDLQNRHDCLAERFYEYRKAHGDK